MAPVKSSHRGSSRPRSVSRRVVAGLGMVVLCAFGLSGVAPATPASGTMTGAVQDGQSGEAVSGIDVTLLDATTAAVGGTAATDAAGEFSVDVPPGTYLARFDDPAGVYAMALSGGATTAAAAQTETVTAGGFAGFPEVDLQRRHGTILGEVWSESPDSAPLESIEVEVHDAASGALAGLDVTNALGEFSVEVPAGAYVVRVVDTDGSHAARFFGEGSSSGDTVLNIQPFDVLPGALIGVGQLFVPRLTGTVHGFVEAEDPLSGLSAPAPDIEVTLFERASGTAVVTGLTDAQGETTIDDVPVGEYLVRFVDPAGVYLPQFAGDADTVAGADVITVDPQFAAGASAVLQADTDPPAPGAAELTVAVSEAGSGDPLEGMNVTVFDAGTFLQVAAGTTSGAGTLVTNLDAGTYVSRAVDPDGVYPTTWSGGSTTVANVASDSAVAVVLPPGVAQVDPVPMESPLSPLVGQATLSGVVEAPLPELGAGTAPVPDATVKVFDLDGMTEVATTTTGAGGEYEVVVPTPARYLVQAGDPDNDRGGVHRTAVLAGADDVLVADVDMTARRFDGGPGSVRHDLPLHGIDVGMINAVDGTLYSGTTGAFGLITFTVPSSTPYVSWAVDPQGRYHCAWDRGTSFEAKRCDQDTNYTRYLSYNSATTVTIPMVEVLTGSEVQRLFSGQVVDASNVGIAGASVTVFEAGSGESYASGLTGADGTYAFLLEENHHYFVRFADPGGTWRAFYAAAALASDATGVLVADEDVTGIDYFVESVGDPLTQGPGQIHVQLTETGTFDAIQGLEVAALDPSSLAVLATSHTDADGEAVLDLNAPDDVLLRYRDPQERFGVVFHGGGGGGGGGATSAADVLSAVTVPVSAGVVTDLSDELTRNRGRILGEVEGTRLEGPGDIPLFEQPAGITVAALDVATLEEVASTQTDEFGEFVLPVPSGDYVFRTTDPDGRYPTALVDCCGTAGTVDGMQPTTIGAGGEQQIRLTLAGGAGRLRGTVSADGGSELEGIDVSAFDSASLEPLGTAVTDADGEYSMDLPPATYLVRAVDPAGAHYPAWSFSDDDVATATPHIVTANQSLSGVAVFMAPNQAPQVTDLQCGTMLVLGSPTDVSAQVADPEADDFEVEIDWGDGGAGEPLLVDSGVVSASHTYADVGEFTVTITATDSTGAAGDASCQVEVLDPDDPAFGPDALDDEAGTDEDTEVVVDVLANDSTGDLATRVLFANSGATPDPAVNRLCRLGGGGWACENAGEDVHRSTDVAVGRVDGDRFADLVFANGFDQPNRVCFADGLNGFDCADAGADANNTMGVDLGDVNGDGELDAVFANYAQANRVCTTDGGGSFSCADLGTGDDRSHDVQLGDIDGDDDLDVIVANQDDPNEVCRGDGAGGFTCAAMNTDQHDTRGVALGDVDGDGDLDAFFATASFSVANSVCLNDGGGAFGCGPVDTPAFSQAAALGDLDGDDDLDAVVANSSGGGNRRCLGNGAGSFSCAALGGDLRVSQDVALADVDGDGELDAAIANLGQTNQHCAGDGGGGLACSDIGTDAFATGGVAIAGGGLPALNVSTAPAHGTAEVNEDGTITYTPDPDFSGSDGFGYRLCDQRGACDTAAVAMTVNPVNDPPVAQDDTAATDENVAIVIDVAANDADVDGNLEPASVAITTAPVNGSAVPGAGGTVTYTPDAGYSGQDTFDYEICDAAAECDTATVAVTVVEAPPVAGIDAVSCTAVPIAIGTAAEVDVTLADPDLQGYTVTIDWGDGATEDFTGAGPYTHTYATPGVFEVVAVVTDSAGVSSDAVPCANFVVVFDPDGGFVTGGGWFHSPPGAYPADGDLEGTATFGFVSKYQKGKSAPTGGTDFRFAAAGLEFRSDQYDWLVIAGSMARYRGTGTVNGEGGYSFVVVATDGDLLGGDGTDELRVRIWRDGGSGEETVYDNQAGDGIDAPATTSIGGGSIVVHEVKSKRK